MGMSLRKASALGGASMLNNLGFLRRDVTVDSSSTAYSDPLRVAHTAVHLDSRKGRSNSVATRSCGPWSMRQLGGMADQVGQRERSGPERAAETRRATWGK